MTGPSPGNLVGTASIVLVPSILFNALVVPDVASATHVAILAIAIFWPLWCVLNLLVTGTTEPGINRRLPSPRAGAGGDSGSGSARSGLPPRYKQETLPNGKSVTVKWNPTCNAYQPPRAHHCSVNDDCVDKFDHHCPWVGTTIGRRNYRTFCLFVFSTTFLCCYVIFVCAWQIKLKHDEDDEGSNGRVMRALGKAPAAMVIMVFTFIGFWFVAVLSGFHAYLIATNQTTYENFRDGYGWDENPYNRGLAGNCYEVFFAPVQPSRFRFREPPSNQPTDEELGMADPERPYGFEAAVVRKERNPPKGSKEEEDSDSEAARRGDELERGDAKKGASRYEVRASEAGKEERKKKEEGRRASEATGDRAPGEEPREDARSPPTPSRTPVEKKKEIEVTEIEVAEVDEVAADAEPASRAGGVMKALALDALEDLEEEGGKSDDDDGDDADDASDASGYEGDRDRTPK